MTLHILSTHCTSGTHKVCYHRTNGGQVEFVCSCACHKQSESQLRLAFEVNDEPRNIQLIAA